MTIDKYFESAAKKRSSVMYVPKSLTQEGLILELAELQAYLPTSQTLVHVILDKNFKGPEEGRPLQGISPKFKFINVSGIQTSQDLVSALSSQGAKMMTNLRILRHREALLSESFEDLLINLKSEPELKNTVIEFVLLTSLVQGALAVRMNLSDVEEVIRLRTVVMTQA
jgi:hypothetical protein